jgi:hypothetical protein
MAAGHAHRQVPYELLKITPNWVPFAPQVILVAGLCESASNGSIAPLCLAADSRLAPISDHWPTGAMGQLLTHAAQQRTSSFGRLDLPREPRGFSENHMGKTCIYRDKVYFTGLVCKFLGGAS